MDTVSFECVIFNVGQNYPRENMDDLLAWSHARDTQLSNGPICAVIRVREVPIQNVNGSNLKAQSTQLWS
jgi:hypothetical protein